MAVFWAKGHIRCVYSVVVVAAMVVSVAGVDVDVESMDSTVAG
jgi:hypothetical protein